VSLSSRLIVPLFAAAGLGGVGCTLVHDAAHNACHQVCMTMEESRELCRDRAWADVAWKRHRAECCGGRPSSAYEDGFKDGFVNLLYRGGNGEPPPLPPKHLRQFNDQTPCGTTVAQAWFAGYRHGAGVARDRGYRQWVTGSSSLIYCEQIAPTDAVTIEVPPNIVASTKPVEKAAPALVPVVHVTAAPKEADRPTMVRNLIRVPKPQ